MIKVHVLIDHKYVMTTSTITEDDIFPRRAGRSSGESVTCRDREKHVAARRGHYDREPAIRDRQDQGTDYTLTMPD